MTDNQSQVDVELGSFTTVGGNVRYDVGNTQGILSNLELVLSIQNLFNESPPLFSPVDNYTVSYDSANYFPIGRFISFSIAKHW